MEKTDMTQKKDTDKITVQFRNVLRKYPKNTRIMDIAEDFRDSFPSRIVLSKVDGRVAELTSTLSKDARVEFLTIQDNAGAITYMRSLVFMMIKAFHDTAPEVVGKVYVDFNVSNGLYCHVKGLDISDYIIERVKERMTELVKEDIPFEKKSIKTSEAIKIFEHQDMHEKARLFHYRRASMTNVYTLDGYQDYFYAYMVPSTGYLDQFELFAYEDGFILQRPQSSAPDRIKPYNPQPKLFETMKRSASWHDTLGTSTVGQLNDLVVNGGANDLILLQEALMEKQIGDIAYEIDALDKKFVLIAGPSSSGKTSFSNRLAVQLHALGRHLTPIACDNYFIDRDKYPKDKYGNVDFESIDCVDIDRLNEDLLALAAGEEVETPVFNFFSGKREPVGKKIRIPKEDIIVLEGIHCLNDRLTYDLPSQDKYKIYISALTPMNIDEHNNISTSDCRLLRRICRDHATRGYSAKDTISRWQSVRSGEEKNIFPYQECADVMVNSALVYESAVLKPFAEPLLFSVPEGCPEYIEAKRLLKFLDYFLTIPSECIPKNSLMREFIGGSLFDV